MTDIRFPPLSAEITPDETPYGYSAYRTIWNDGAGYDRTTVGSEQDENGRLVIMVALSPGQYVPVTMVSAGWATDRAESTLLGMITEASARPDLAGKHPRTGSARASVDGGQTGRIVQ